MVAALCHRGDCVYLMHSSVQNARSALCKVCMFGSSLRGETHLEDSENKLCSEYKSPCARQDEWFYINYCSNTTFVEPVISSLYTFKGGIPVLRRTWKVFIMHTNVTEFNVQYSRWNHEDLALRPISHTAVRWYSPVWLSGNQACVCQWWTCSWNFGVNQDGKLFPTVRSTYDGLVWARWG